MYSSDGSDHHGMQVFFLQHFVVVAIDFHALEVFCRPFSFVFVWGTRRYYMCSGSELIKIYGVAFTCWVVRYGVSLCRSSRRGHTHSAKAGNSNSELSGGHPWRLEEY